MIPKARQDKLLVQEVGDELVVYDQKRHRAHRLNQTAAVVWRHCDGKMTGAEIATLLHSELSLPANEDVVWLALDRLGKAHLLRESLTRPAGVANISRRQVVRRLGLTGAVVLLLPMITSIVAPTPALAQSAESAVPAPCSIQRQGSTCCRMGPSCSSGLTSELCRDEGGTFFRDRTCIR